MEFIDLTAVLNVFLGIVAVMMTFFILIQRGSDGLESFRGTKAELIQGISDPLKKSTAYLAAAFFVLVIVLAGK